MSDDAVTSHPSRVRGLKFFQFLFDIIGNHIVAPFTGAWIEIDRGDVCTIDSNQGRTLHGCVD